MFFLTFFSSYVHGKVELTYLKGEIVVQNKNGRTSPLRTGQSFEENVLVVSGRNSVGRFRFENGSLVTMGSSSAIFLARIAKKKSDIVRLIKGKIRALVQKKENQKYSMHVTTKSVSLGVRGTDFLIVHNNENQVSSVLTFTGKVDLFKRPDQQIREEVRAEASGLFAENLDGHLDSLVEEFTNDDIETVEANNYSGGFPGRDVPTKAMKIAAEQFEALKANEFFKSRVQVENQIVPISEEQIAEIESHLIPAPEKSKHLPPSSEGLPGGLLDLETGIYLSPPTNAHYDDKNKVFSRPAYYGSVDRVSGEYVPPPGLQLHPLKGFVVAVADKFSEAYKVLNRLSGKLNGRIEKNLRKFKSVTHLDWEGTAAFSYDSNVHENYYGERRNVTNTGAMVWSGRGELAHQSIRSKSFLLRPKISGYAKYHGRRKDQGVKLEDQGHVAGGLEIVYKYEFLKNEADSTLESHFRTHYKDFRNRNSFDFYNEDYYFRWSHTLRPTRKNIAVFSYENLWFQGFDNINNGRRYQFDIQLTQLMGRRFSARYEVVFSKRKDDVFFNVVEGWQNRVGLDIKNWIDDGKILLSGGYELWQSQKRVDFKKAVAYLAGIEFNKNWGTFSRVHFKYDFFKQNANEGANQRNFRQHLYQIGIQTYF